MSFQQCHICITVSLSTSLFRTLLMSEPSTRQTSASTAVPRTTIWPWCRPSLSAVTSSTLVTTIWRKPNPIWFWVFCGKSSGCVLIQCYSARYHCIIIPPHTKFGGYIVILKSVRSFVLLSVRPSRSLIHYSSKTAEQNFMKLSGIVHYMMPYCTSYFKFLSAWFWGFPEQNKNFAITTYEGGTHL